MRTFFSPILSSLVVVFALFILISEDQMVPVAPASELTAKETQAVERD